MAALTPPPAVNNMTAPVTPAMVNSMAALSPPPVVNSMASVNNSPPAAISPTIISGGVDFNAILRQQQEALQVVQQGMTVAAQIVATNSQIVALHERQITSNAGFERMVRQSQN